MAVTSVRMRSRGALKAVARSSMIASNVASPVHLFRTSAETASALNTRSGASSTHPPCASLCTRRTPRGSRGRASGAIAEGVSFMAGPRLSCSESLQFHLLGGRYESARRHVLRCNIGMIECVQHRPQHVAFEFERGQHLCLRLRRARVLLDIVERKARVALGLR